MGKKTRHQDATDTTDSPPDTTSRILERQDSSEYPEESPIEEGIIEEQQGDLEGLDGENTLNMPFDDETDLEVADELELEATDELDDADTEE